MRNEKTNDVKYYLKSKDGYIHYFECIKCKSNCSKARNKGQKSYFKPNFTGNIKEAQQMSLTWVNIYLKYLDVSYIEKITIHIIRICKTFTHKIVTKKEIEKKLQELKENTHVFVFPT